MSMRILFSGLLLTLIFAGPLTPLLAIKSEAKVKIPVVTKPFPVKVPPKLTPSVLKSIEAEKMGKIDDAIQALKMGAKETDKVLYNNRLGWLQYLKKNHKESLASYKMAQKLDPKNMDALHGILVAHSNLNNFKEVEAIGGKILKTDPNNYLANYHLGVAAKAKKDVKAAKKFFEKFPKDPASMKMLKDLSK